MYASLPQNEIIFYLLVVVAPKTYITWNVFLSSNILVETVSDENLVPGWSLFNNRVRDITDFEWTAFQDYIFSVAPWLILQVISAQLCRCFCTKSLPIILPIVYFFITMSFVINIFGGHIALHFLLSAIAFFVGSFTKSKIIIWVLGISVLLLNTYYFVCDENWHGFNKCLIRDVSLAWFVLRSIDFALFSLKLNCKEKLLNYMGYGFYLPTFIFGPCMPFEDFYQGLHNPSPLTLKKCRTLTYNLLKFCFWGIIFNILSHFLYCNSLVYNLRRDIVGNAWTLNGIGFCLSQFFFLKYFVMYGLGGCISRFEGIDAPPPPRCVMRVHLYSNMWRYFDRGYYLFTVNCIYKPVCGSPKCSKIRKFVASIICFCFVFLWHGMNKSIFWWSLLNFLGISLEAIGRYISTLPVYDSFSLNFSPQNIRRISCMFMAPVWILAVLSNFFFFGGYRYGFILISQIIYFKWKVILITYIIAYCICQVAVEVEIIEYKRNKNSIKAKVN